MVEKIDEANSNKAESLEGLRENLGALMLFSLYNECPENIEVVRVLGREIIKHANSFIKVDELIIPINEQEIVNVRKEDCKNEEKLSIYTLDEIVQIYNKECGQQTESINMLRGIAQMA